MVSKLLNPLLLFGFVFLVTSSSLLYAQNILEFPISGLLSDRVVYLKGDIDDSNVDYVITKLKTLDKVSNADIKLIINSGGGSVYSGVLLYDVIKSLDSDVSTICEGICMSMAASILSAGEPGKRFATTHSTIMIHEVSSRMEGTLSQMQTDIAETIRLQKLLVKMLSEGTGKTSEEIEALMKSDYFMTADQAKELKFIDDIIIKSE